MLGQGGWSAFGTFMMSRPTLFFLYFILFTLFFTLIDGNLFAQF